MTPTKQNAIPMDGVSVSITAGAYAAPVCILLPSVVAWRYRAPDAAMFCDN
jgi:hypothetical protein